MDMYKRGNYKYSKVNPKYTNGGSSNLEIGKSKRFYGWSEEGLIRYNVLFELVKNDRSEPHGKLFEEEFKMMRMKEDEANNNKKKIDELETLSVINVKHELWSEEEEEEEEEDIEEDEEDVDQNENENTEMEVESKEKELNVKPTRTSRRRRNVVQNMTDNDSR